MNLSDNSTSMELPCLSFLEFPFKSNQWMLYKWFDHYDIIQIKSF